MKKVLTMVLVIAMVAAFAAPALAAERIEGGNPVFLGLGMPEYVLFSDGQIDGVIVWLPEGSDLDWDYVCNDINSSKGMPGWWSNNLKNDFFYGEERYTAKNHDFWVAQGEDGWYAYKTGDKISNTLWVRGEEPEVPDWFGIEIDPSIYVTTVNTRIIEKWQGEETPYQTITQYVAQYDSTTLTKAGYNVEFDSKNKVIGNDVVVPGSNHFAYAKLDKAALESGESFDLALVNGSKVNEVGTASVSMVDGKLVVEFDAVFSGTYGFVAADGFLPYAKNGNIHSLGIFKTGSSMDVEILTKGSYQDKDKKAANYDKDWADITGNNAISDSDYIYLYMHANPITFDRGNDISEIEVIETKEPEVVWTKTITNKVGPEQDWIEFEVYEGLGDYSEKEALDNNELSDIPEGWYTVVFNDPYLDEPAIIAIEAVANEMLKVTYGEGHSVPGETTTKRIDLPNIINPLETIYKTVYVK